MEGVFVIRGARQGTADATSYTTRERSPDATATLRVVHVEAGRHVFGGARQVLYLCEALARHGVESVLACTQGSDFSVAAHARGLEVVSMRMGGDLDLGLVPRLARCIRAQRADLVHLHSRRGADTLGLLAARLAGVPVVLSRRVDNPPRGLQRLLLRRGYDRVICISRGIERVLASAGVAAARTTVVPSAVDVRRFTKPCRPDELRSLLALPPEATVMGMVAQLIPRKGHRVAFDALAKLRRRHRNLYLVCFGSGSQGKALEAYAKEVGVADRVLFAGFRDDMARLSGAMDLLVHPALAEGLGVALLEAAAARCPMVATDVGGIPEIVEDGVTGRLVPPGDADALAGAIDALLSDRAAARRMANAARRRVLDQHSVASMAAGNYAVYREVLAQRRK